MPPLYVTENGAAFDDPVVDGVCHDERRIRYLDAHLRAVRRAIAAGVDVRGYYAWSLFDNFEWAWGFAQRFGLVHVDFDTQVRTPKSSARWYSDICRTNVLTPLDERVSPKLTKLDWRTRPMLVNSVSSISATQLRAHPGAAPVQVLARRGRVERAGVGAQVEQAACGAAPASPG